MIQITRQLAKVLRSVIKRTFNRQVNSLHVRTSDQGLFVEVQGPNQALRYHDPIPQDAEQLVLPLQVLDDVQGAKAEPVFLNTRRDGVVGASWQENGVFRDLEYDAPDPATTEATFPEVPAKFIDNPPELLTAIRDAYDTTDMESKRYALGCIQLRRDGVIAATDGRQMLRQTGFTFGLDEDVLVQPTRFFASKELPSGESFRIGELRDDKGVLRVVFEIGPWTYWVGTEREGRFPDIDHVIPSSDHCKATLQLSLADSKFMLDNLHRLPNGDTHREVTLDLNGSVILRASAAGVPRPAEMILRNSAKLGSDIRLCTDRVFLARAARLGFSEIHFPDSQSPAIARDASRTFVWMLLDPKEAIKPTDSCVRIESPLDIGRRSSSIPIARQEISVNRIPSVSTSGDAVRPANAATTAAPAETSTRRKRTGSKPSSSLDQAVALRDQLRTALACSKGLIRCLKAEKRGQKSLKLALASLKQLQVVA